MNPADAEEARELLEALKLEHPAAEAPSSSDDDEVSAAAAAGDAAAPSKASKKRKKKKGKASAAPVTSASAADAKSTLKDGEEGEELVPDVSIAVFHASLVLTFNVIPLFGFAVQPEKSDRLKELNKNLSRIADKPHTFWDTQPVPKLGTLF